MARNMERYYEAERLRNEGHTLKEIGEIMTISSQRVREMLNTLERLKASAIRQAEKEARGEESVSEYLIRNRNHHDYLRSLTGDERLKAAENAEDIEDLLDLNILSTRAFRALKRGYINTVFEMASLTREKLLSFSGISAVTADEILNVVEYIGLARY
jgi:Mn-dependent DtxR family transcriptional regulator